MNTVTVSGPPPGGHTLDGFTVLITGGTGSFGEAIARNLLRAYAHVRIVIFSRDEYKQHKLSLSLSGDERQRLQFFVGDVRDRCRLSVALRGVDCVVHAAAMKQIAAAEENPFECINTNVIGAENLIHAAIEMGVRRVIALSTDKAASPANVYGASKLAAERLFISANRFARGTGCRFSVVRYGNVVGSRGSVVPIFAQMIAAGARALPITDERMTRFWISLTQGVNFVHSCLHAMAGGEVFVPKIPSMKLVDLARALDPRIDFHVIGIRPGEKLHEVLITQEDARSTVDLGDRYVIEPTSQSWYQEGPKALERRGQPVSLEFSYTSDRNSDWLDTGRLHRLLAESSEQCVT